MASVAGKVGSLSFWNAIKKTTYHLFFCNANVVPKTLRIDFNYDLPFPLGYNQHNRLQ